MAHELEELEVDEGGITRGGAFYGVRTKGGRGLRGLIGLEKKVPNEPFATWAAWVPTTRVVLRVPEIALLPRIVVRPSDRMAALGNPKLDDVGLGGFRMAESRWIGEDLRRAAGAAARPLGSLPVPFAALTIDHGLVSVHRNGFAGNDEIDPLVGVASAIAEGLVAMVAPLLAPQPFEQPLPPPDLATWPPGFWQPQPHEADAFGRAAAELGLQPEDAVALHRTFPRLPAPGTAMGAARGVLPGSSAAGRVAFFGQGGRTSGTYRTVTMVPARPGAATPIGGQVHQPTDTYAEVVDGVAVAWPRVRREGRLDSAESVAAALDTFRALGLADA